MSNSPTEENAQQPVADQLETIAEVYGVTRVGGENDENFASRLLSFLDDEVERIWDAQDKILGLVS